MTRWIMRKSEAKTEPNTTTESTVPVAPGKKGCPTSFLTQNKSEMDKVCGGVGGEAKEEYVQPDAEKESGGEG